MDAMPLQIGDPAPEFTLPDQAGNPVSLKDLRGQRVIIYFYPKDDTPGCTKEACNFRDQWAIYEANSIRVLGISKDNAKSHSKFIDKYTLPFTLLSDPQSDDESEPSCPVATAYESYGLKKFMGREYDGIFRISYLIDENGVIEKVYGKVKTKSHGSDVLADMDG